ncbi:hypothetical protein LOAG_00053, partial [Loa loa]
YYFLDFVEVSFLGGSQYGPNKCCISVESQRDGVKELTGLRHVNSFFVLLCCATPMLYILHEKTRFYKFLCVG